VTADACNGNEQKNLVDELLEGKAGEKADPVFLAHLMNQ